MNDIEFAVYNKKIVNEFQLCEVTLRCPRRLSPRYNSYIEAFIDAAERVGFKEFNLCGSKEYYEFVAYRIDEEGYFIRTL